MLYKIIYASQAAKSADDASLQALLAAWRRQNEATGLTGLLLFCNQSFLQILEGNLETVDRLYDKIKVDSRHQNVRLLSRAPIAERRFSAWSMGFENIDDETLAAHLPGYIPPTPYPLVDAKLIRNGTVAESLLNMYQRNASTH